MFLFTVIKTYKVGSLCYAIHETYLKQYILGMQIGQ